MNNNQLIKSDVIPNCVQNFLKISMKSKKNIGFFCLENRIWIRSELVNIIHLLSQSIFKSITAYP